jgi:predicted adenine nucleotide alpha hydrolase (AANH) superfamily ATPase
MVLHGDTNKTLAAFLGISEQSVSNKINENGKAFYSDNCIKHARNSFEKSTLINKYIDLYSKLCEEK